MRRWETAGLCHCVFVLMSRVWLSSREARTSAATLYGHEQPSLPCLEPGQPCAKAVYHMNPREPGNTCPGPRLSLSHHDMGHCCCSACCGMEGTGHPQGWWPALGYPGERVVKLPLPMVSGGSLRNQDGVEARTVLSVL